MIRPLAALLALVLCLPAFAATAGEIAVKAVPVPLDPFDPAHVEVGGLTYLGGVQLSAKDRRFGGWSGLVVDPEGRRIVAQSDMGWWLTADLVRDGAGRISGLAHAQIIPLLAPNGRALAGDKKWADAEGLDRAANGDLIVSFERHHRVWRYSAPGAEARPVEAPAEIRRQPANGGIEAVAALPDGRLAALSEQMTTASGNHVGWVFGAAGSRRIEIATTGAFDPTDFKVAPGGGYLMLERSYLPLIGGSARISRIDSLDRPGTIVSKTVAVLTSDLTIDNFEGMGLWRDGAGRTHVMLLSDDNQLSIERTLLLEFLIASPPA